MITAKFLIKSIWSGVLILGLVACGAEREHKPLPKIEVFSKSAIDTEAEYLYVPSTDEVSRNTNIGRPYFQGQERIVKLKFEKNHLVAYALEKDDRFTDNITNSKPVFRIPIRHIDYREAIDPFGEGTNIEEENNYIDWPERRYFEPKPEEFQFADVNALPTEFEKIFGYECSSQTGQAELNFEVEESGIDIVIKRDFKTTYQCNTSISELLDLSWSEVTHYSLVPLKNLASEDYETVVYERDWERTFGYFETLDQKLDSSNASTQDGEVYYMNRWNPKRKEVVYYLDPRFEKPENASIKQATLIGFDRLNVALEKANANFRLVPKAGPEGMRPGDLRYTSVVLVEDPLAVGLLGYGPSVANPRTGEIVQARTVMYPGVMRRFVRQAYDEVLRLEAQSLKQSSQNFMDANPNLINELRGFGQLSTELRSSVDWEPYVGDMSHMAVTTEPTTSGANAPSESDTQRDHSVDQILNQLSPIVDGKPVLNEDFLARGDKLLFNWDRLSLRTVFDGFVEQNESSPFNMDPLEVMEFYSKNNMFPAREKSFMDVAEGVLKDQILQLGGRKPWDQLDDETRKTIVDLVMPYVWIPTFIHEIGHNLGLRHNFAGSEDEANFYTLDELHDHGLDVDTPSPYASMMEYTKSEVTGLRIPGKYDIAALKYGYAGQVELEDGSVVAVEDKLPSELGTLKLYEYCSDEGVSLNPNCNRFDEGVGYKAIATSLIESYNERYRLRNYRSGRSNFSLMDEVYYASRVNSTFRSLRLMLERLSDIMMDFDIDMATVEQVDWLKDMNDGAKIAAEFFQTVLAEPDLSCILTQNGQFAQIIPYKEIKTLTGSTYAKDCFQIEGLNTEFQIVGQFGRLYESERYRDNPNIYLDQIDVQGVWVDKLLALKYLVARSLNNYSFDKRTLSFLDHPEVGSDINALIKNVLFGDVKSKNTVTFIDGTTMEDFEFGHSFAFGYDIKKPLTSYVSRYLGLKYDKVDFVEAMAQIISKETNRGETSVNNEIFKESLRVYSALPEDGRELADFNIYRLGPQNYVVSQDNELGMQTINRLKKIDLYDQFTRDDLVDIYLVMANGQPVPPDVTAEQQQVYDNGQESLLMYLRGELPDKSYYYKLMDQVSQL